jgi:hypothetical protein
MKIDDWLKTKSAELEKSLTEEARGLGLTKKKVVCKLHLQSAEFEVERVYPAQLSVEDKKKILNLGFPAKHLEMINILVEGPRKYVLREDTWWKHDCHQSMNTRLRSAGVSWRVVVVGDWKNCVVHLGTIEKTSELFLGSVRYKTNGVILRNSKILFEHRL